MTPQECLGSNVPGPPNPEPTLNTNFALGLKNKCPNPNTTNPNAGEFLDSTASVFDNDYYTQILGGKGLFSSDQSLAGDSRTRWIVEEFAKDPSVFFEEFVDSMLKLGNVGVLENGEVRLNCKSFAKRGLSIKDLVTLSGGHTLGFSHCSSFQSRLHNFSFLHDIDPTLNTNFALGLKNKCPNPNTTSPNAGEFLDSTTSVFDNDYYTQSLGGNGLFSSDQSLAGDSRIRWIVEAFAIRACSLRSLWIPC
ncbi:hypothetical protein Ahy_B05g074109 [Arachis hypogaea]|uniref:peroxidase n=1 Tax=Arachis hypogaea TaxID=3818 RepID=A0A444YXY7_ARAHY|nr:hypothetical protein Ahy_B05g074109 [Arachis hypogaea]